LKSAYSLIELLVGLSILILITSIASVRYKNYQKTSYETWSKAELAYINGLMKTAYGADGFYHQYIYQMGYRPQENILATVGIPADTHSFLPCCYRLPALGTSCREGYLFYKCKSSEPHNLTDNVAICNHLGVSRCKIQGHLTNLGTDPLSNLTPSATCPTHFVSHDASQAWCNCSKYTLVAKTSYGSTSPSPSVTDQSYFTLNELGTLCSSRQTQNLTPSR